MKFKFWALVAYGIYEYNKKQMSDGKPSIFSGFTDFFDNMKMSREARDKQTQSTTSEAEYMAPGDQPRAM